VKSERLFLEKMRGIADLVGRSGPSDYELIRASGDYRHILLDGLLDSANRDARMKLSINVLPESGMRSKGTLISWDAVAISPRSASPDATTEMVKPQKFEKRRLISLMFEDYTVKDVILTSANFLGGVHDGPPTREAELRLQHLYDAAEMELITVMLEDGSAATVPAPIFPLLREIGECLVDSLDPLVQLLSARSN
jgi:hypothetical protein